MMLRRHDSGRTLSPPRLVGCALAITMALLSGSVVPYGGISAEGDGVAAVGAGAFTGRQSASAPNGSENAIERTFEWTHAGETWRLTITGDQDLLDDYADRDRLLYSHDYEAYALDSAGAAWVDDLAHRLDALYAAGGITGTVARLEAILAFVQHLPYASDLATTGNSEWARYPMETVFATANDCEDTSVLYAGLVRALGFDAILINPPRHMAVGVAQDAPLGTYATHDGDRYYYAETTGEGWSIGTVPPVFSEGPFRPLTLGSQAILSRPAVETHVAGKTVLATLTVHNVGDLAADDVVLGAMFQSPANGTWSESTCTPQTLPGESSLTCHIVLDAPPAGSDMRLGAWARSPDAPNRFTTQDWSPDPLV